MRKFIRLINVLLLTSLSIASFAQDGRFDVRFDLHDVDCNVNKIYINIEVRANNPSNEFNLADQNYRFSHTKGAIVPGSIRIDTMYLTGIIGQSFYEPHTLTGSLDSVVSYNVVLAGGVGELITTTWRTIGRISFDILDIDQCLELMWHDHSPALFPPTFIGEKFNNVLYETTEGLYLNNSTCPAPECTALPIELISFEAREIGCSIVLDWATASEKNNDYFQVEKSTDGETFEVIATIEGAGTSNELIHYTYIDAQPATHNYYRLTQVDYDRTSTSSLTLAIKSTCFENVAFQMADIYPNPVSEGPVNIRFYTEVEIPNPQVVITDVTGRIVHTESAEIVKGQNILTVESALFPTGTYFVQIRNKDFTTKARKFIKINN